MNNRHLQQGERTLGHIHVLFLDDGGHQIMDRGMFHNASVWVDKRLGGRKARPNERTISIGRDDRFGRVIQGDGLAIREDDHGLFGLACDRQASIFYRNWPGKWVLSGQGKACGGLDDDSERLEKQAERGKTLERIAFPETFTGLGVVSLEEGVMFF